MQNYYYSKHHLFGHGAEEMHRNTQMHKHKHKKTRSTLKYATNTLHNMKTKKWHTAYASIQFLTYSGKLWTESLSPKPDQFIAVQWCGTKGKGKGQALTTGLLTVSQIRDRKHFTISEVAADWHELTIPQRTMRPSSALVSKQLDPRFAASRHTTAPISHTRPSPHSL